MTPDWASTLIRASRLFDSEWYLRQNPEVVALGLDPVTHFLRYGARLGRNPGPDFDLAEVGRLYPDDEGNAAGLLVRHVWLGQARRPVRAPAVVRPDETVGRLRRKLLTLGFTREPLAALRALAEGEDAGLKALAATELALWSMRQAGAEAGGSLLADPEGARRAAAGWQQALDWAALARTNAAPLDLRRVLAVVELLCLHSLNRVDGGESAYREACLQGLATPDLTLAWANLAADRVRRIERVNTVMTSHGLAPLALRSEPGRSAYDQLDVADSTRPAPVTDGPLVSVIVAAYEAGATLATALRSLEAQSWRNIEVLVVDDASPSPETARIAAEFAARDARFRLIRLEKNGGAYVARNRGLDAVLGHFVTLHDADDWAHPMRIETQVRALLDRPDLIGCSSQQARMREDLTFRKWAWGGTVRLLRENVSSFMVRHTPAFEAVGYWDSVRFGADDERIARLRKAYGAGALTVLQTGPLAFQRDIETSAVAHPAFGADGPYWGARLEYAQAQAWHHSQRGLRYDKAGPAPNFAVPRVMRADREAVPLGCDLCLAGDTRAEGDALNRLIEAIENAIEAEERVVVVPLSRDVSNGSMQPLLRRYLERGFARLAVYGETLGCGRLRITDPKALQLAQRFLPRVSPARIEIERFTDLDFSQRILLLDALYEWIPAAAGMRIRSA